MARSKLGDRSVRRDRFHQKAKQEGFLARAVYKLQEIDDKFGLFAEGQRVLDLGCSPGSWLQYARSRVGDRGVLVGLDRSPLQGNVGGARIVVGDVLTIDLDALRGDVAKFDVVLSDMAPDTTGIRSMDQARSEALFERALEIATLMLAPGGNFVGKLFQGPDFKRLIEAVRAKFDTAKSAKPDSSRQISIEQYVIGKGFLVSAPLRIAIDAWGEPSPRKIAQAVEVLHAGGVAAYPTDSVYALGCAIESREAIERIHRAKNMAKHQRLALICPDLSSASQYGLFSQTAFRLAQRIFPGPYTLVVPATRDVPKLLTDAKRRTVGIRVTSHPIAQALARELGRPLLTSSAIGPDSTEPCRDADEILETFGRFVDVVIDSAQTPAEPSTVIEVDGDTLRLIRQGQGPVDDILDIEEVAEVQTTGRRR